MLKKLLFGLVAALLLAVGGVWLNFFVLSPKARAAQDLKAPDDPETIERGRYLAHNVLGCVPCHSEVDEAAPGEPLVEGKLFSGRQFPEDPYGAGVIRAPNLTPKGIGEYTDGELVRALLEGIDRHGEPLFPMMPYPTYGRLLSQADALAVVAYLRTVEPVDHDPGKAEIAFPVSMFVRAAPAPVETDPSVPPADGSVERGRWLLEVASCGDCHHSVDDKRQPIPGKEFAGGTKFPLGGGKVVRTPNITSDEATGLGAYSDADLRRALFEGKAKDGRDLYGMPWVYYAGMSDSDKDALVKAVREIPAVVNPVSRDVQ